MIVVDSSALLATISTKRKASFASAIVAADAPRIPAPNLLEASLVAEARYGEAGCRELDRDLKRAL